MYAMLSHSVATLTVPPSVPTHKPSLFVAMTRLAKSVVSALPNGDLSSRSKVALQAIAHLRGVPLLEKGGYAAMTRETLIAVLSNAEIPPRVVKPDSVADLRARAIAKGLGKSIAGKYNKAALTAYVDNGTVPTPSESTTARLRRIAREESLDGRGKATTGHALICLIRSKCHNADALLTGIDETAIAKAHASRQAAKTTGLTATVCRQLIAYAIESGRITKENARGRSTMKADDLRAFVERFSLHVPADSVKVAA